MKTSPRPEHPRPQFQRRRWLSLNDWWDFAFDFGSSGEARGLHQDTSGFDRQIQVPFCPESSLSGIQHTDFMSTVWYHREIALPKEWAGAGVRLHFGAVDYVCTVWLNGALAGRHYGAGSSFHFDLTTFLQAGTNHLVVRAEDDSRSGKRPQGKQCPEFASEKCLYTRTTGIWQTVWLEAIPEARIEAVRVVPDVDGSCFVLTPEFANSTRDQRFRAVLLDGETVLASGEREASPGLPLVLAIPDARLWSPEDPYLYDLRFELLDASGGVVDRVESYAGLRKIHIEGNRIYLNNEPLFIRFVLDQGFYPDGIWTAPSDAALKRDIELALAAGFNGARLHQKIFEERYHYWADRMGFLTWAEMHDWGMDFKEPEALLNHQREWAEVVMRDINHPSIIAWTPFNETLRGARADLEVHRRALTAIYDLTKMLDPTRPCHGTSGHVQVKTDIFSAHCYNQNPEQFAERFAALTPDEPEKAPVCHPDLSSPYTGQPYVVAEYGGTWWDSGASESKDNDLQVSWGYGARPTSIEEVYHRIEALTAVLLRHPHIAGFCFTQLTDVEQEQNGLYTYDRREKFDIERIRKMLCNGCRCLA